MTMNSDPDSDVSVSAFETLRDVNGRWVPDMTVTSDSTPEPTTALAKTRRSPRRPQAPDITSATTLSGDGDGPGTVDSDPVREVGSDGSGGLPGRERRPSVTTVLNGSGSAMANGDDHAFFQTDVPRSKKELELFDPDSDDSQLTEPEGPGVEAPSATRNAIEWFVVVIAAVLLALVLRAFLVQAFYIPSISMEPTLEVKDRVLVNKLSYAWGEPTRGDVVVFHREDAEAAKAAGLTVEVIKRVIGLPGDTIEVRDNVFYLNGNPLDEPFIMPGGVNPDFGPVTVEENHIFVMGDNRTNSDDSRGSLGQISEEQIVGRAFVIYWPVGRIARL